MIQEPNAIGYETYLLYRIKDKIKTDLLYRIKDKIKIFTFECTIS